jgi:flavorubredoxin
MHCTKKLTNDIIWLGASDRRLAMFENAFPISRGVSYNSYLISDEKTLLLDTVDKAVSSRFFENLESIHIFLSSFYVFPVLRKMCMGYKLRKGGLSWIL